ncbi:atp-dependent dna helicase uvrd/pcra [hydrocarbon metagenome]|uniref:DNA 3'-5' helicase n=1 Tax=hydrocarbon metagenome TaxID=938273 RepID=A0A0W8F4B1_9ZZZZ
MQLNPAQVDAVTCQGIQLILAGPGSGKTRVITEKIRHLIATGVPPSHILALTFSDKAAQEMRDRLDQEPQSADLTVSTFHAFCLSVLEENRLDSGINFSSGVISRANQLVWGLKNIDSFGFEHIEVGNNAVDVIEAIIDGISTFRDELIAPGELATYLKGKEQVTVSAEESAYLGKLSDLLRVYRAYERFKRAEMLLDYDDMIHETCRLFERKPLILRRYRERFTHILVDEFQDTNYAQLQLIKMLAGDHLCVVGDDDQTIYRFRGAYLTNMQDFLGHFRDAREILLTHNYRSTQTILTLALALMHHAPNRREKRLLTKNPPGDPVRVVQCENEATEASYVVGEIERLLGTPFTSRREKIERPYTCKDFAIVCRRRRDGAKFYQLLRDRGIPAEFVGEMEFFSAPVIRDLLAYLKSINNPLLAGIPLNRVMKISGIPETEVQKINAVARKATFGNPYNDGVFEAMQSSDSLAPHHATAVRELLGTLDRLILEKDRGTLTGLVHQLMMQATDLYARALEDETGQEVLLLNQFLTITREYEEITKDATVDSFLTYLRFLSGFSIEVGETDVADSVKVLTVHKSKGKEFPVVFVGDLAVNRFPLQYQAKEFVVPNDLSKGMKTTDDEKALFLQEERRLLYVAMTRAEDLLYLTRATWYGNNKNPTKQSKFLDELPLDDTSLVRKIEVPAVVAAPALRGENALEQYQHTLQYQARRAIHQLHLQTALQHIVTLEKLRLVSEGHVLSSFNRDAFLMLPENDAEIEALMQGHTPCLVGESHTFSASELGTYERCPLKYKYQYVVQIPSLSRTFFDLGKAVHTAIEHLSKKQKEGIPPTKEMALALLDTAWSTAAYESKSHEEKDRETAEALLDTYLSWQAGNPNRILEVEKRFQISLGGRLVRGAIDRIEETPDGGIVVIDFKTGSKSGNISKNTIQQDMQMNLYSLAVRELYGKLPVRASLYYLAPNKTYDYQPTVETIGSFEERVVNLIRAVCAEEFSPTPDYQMCRWCDYKDFCEEGE